MNMLMDIFYHSHMFTDPPYTYMYMYSSTIPVFTMFSLLLVCVFAGAIALAEVLAENKHITHLDLKENDIRVAGLMGLQLAHRMNHTLVSMETPKGYRVEPVRRESRTSRTGHPSTDSLY